MLCQEGNCAGQHDPSRMDCATVGYHTVSAILKISHRRDVVIVGAPLAPDPRSIILILITCSTSSRVTVVALPSELTAWCCRLIAPCLAHSAPGPMPSHRPRQNLLQKPIHRLDSHLHIVPVHLRPVSTAPTSLLQSIEKKKRVWHSNSFQLVPTQAKIRGISTYRTSHIAEAKVEPRSSSRIEVDCGAAAR